MDATQTKVALEGAETFLNADEVHVVLPEHGGVLGGEVAAQEILAFAQAGDSELLAIKFEVEGVLIYRILRRWEVKGDGFHVRMLFTTSTS